MLEVEDACRILGVHSNAGRSEIEKRYAIILKKHRLVDGQGESSAEEQEEFKRTTQAYNLLMGYEEPVEEAPHTPNPLLVKMGIDEKKARNFFYYYKFHMLIGLALLVIIVLTVRSFVNRVEPDFNTVFIGEINYTDTEKLYAQIKEALPVIKEPGFDGAYITAEGNGQQDYAMVMKAIAIFTSGGADLLIADKPNFDKFAKDGGFVNLDDIAAGMGIDPSNGGDLRLQPEDAAEEHLYGIDVSDSPALARAGVKGTRMIAAIPANTKKQDTAVKLIEYLLKK